MTPNNTQDNSGIDFSELRYTLEDGSYFTQARQWYKEQFVAPISQRNWMVVAAASAIFAAFSALLALNALMPLTYRPAIPASQERIWDYVISGNKLRSKGVGRDEAILQFFIKEYVTRRESYVHNRYEDYQRFVAAHSSEDVFEQYDAVYGEENARSLRSVLKKAGRRIIEIEHIKMNYSGVIANATVTLRASFFGIADLPSTKWRVKLRAYYRPMVVREKIDVIDADVKLDIKPASFKVSQYELEKIS